MNEITYELPQLSDFIFGVLVLAGMVVLMWIGMKYADRM